MKHARAMQTEVDAAAGLPLYRQVCAVLLNRIANGEYRVGERLPTEEMLAAQFSISRVTVRLALDELEREGLLVRRRALGTFLAATLPARGPGVLRRRLGIDQLIQSAAGRGRLVRHGRLMPAAVIASELGLDSGIETPFFVKTLPAEGDLPRRGVKRHLAPDLAPLLSPALFGAADFEAALQESARQPVVRSHAWTEAVLAEPQMVVVLGVPAGSALYSLWWLCTMAGRPAFVTQMLLPGDALAGCFDLPAGQ